METSNFHHYLNLNELEQRGEFFDFYKKEWKKKYDAQRYQRNKKQLKRYYAIKKKCQALGLPKPKLVNGVVMGEPKTPLTKSERNHNHYINKKRHKKELNNFLGDVASLGNHPLISKKRYREKNRDTKIKLRQSGKNTLNIFNNILGKEIIVAGEKKKGRPLCLEAQLLGRPLTNAERQKRKRAKQNLYTNSKKAIVNMVDDPNIRIETINKIPTKAGMKLKDWPNWWEKLTWPQLIDKNKEAGARTGKPVKYFKRWYKELICLDGDFWKYLGLNQEERELIHRHSVERQQKLGVGYNKTDGGQHDYYLFKENLKDIVIKWGDHRPAEILKLGRQFQFEGEGKEWIENQQHPRRGAKIVKNTWGFCQILNRLFKKYGFGYWVEEIDRWKPNKKKASNTNIYQPQEFQQNFQRLLSETKLNQTIFIKEKILNLTERRDLKTDKWREPWIARTDTFFFFFNSYYSNQAKLLNYEGATMKLQLKRGTAGFHLNKIIAVCQY